MKRLFVLSIFVVIIISSFASANISNNNKKENRNIIYNQKTNGYINITAQEAWEIMNNSEDGRQIPIDIRRWDEYTTERIKPPNSEDFPRWFPYEFVSDGPGPIKNEGILLKLFLKVYSNKEIIIYCRTGRRTGISAQILIDNGFTGTIYNMVDGITDWKAEGLPTILGIRI